MRFFKQMPPAGASTVRVGALGALDDLSDLVGTDSEYFIGKD
jgi:hypothetical protein